MPGDFLVTFRTREVDYRYQVNLHCPICPRYLRTGIHKGIAKDQ